MSDKITLYLEMFIDWVVKTAGKLLLFIVVLMIGLRMIKFIKKMMKKWFGRHNVDPSVGSFLISFLDIGLKIVLFMCSMGILGVELTSFLALFSSVGIAIGLAVQGSLSNIAGGILILLLKPFQVGDYIIEDNHKNEGTVVAIDIFYTRLYTVDNKTVVVPNGTLANSSLTNVTRQDKRRIDLFVGISYTENIARVKKVLEEVIAREENILQEDEITIFVNSFDASSISMGIRVWSSMDLYWKTRWSLLEHIKEAFDREEIEIPYDQLDVHVVNTTKTNG